MEQLPNAFSALELDAGDDRLPNSPGRCSNDGGTSVSCLATMILISFSSLLLAFAILLLCKNKKKANGTKDNSSANNGKKAEEVVPVTGYKLPLVWIDLEMTGLNVEVDRILEIACIITDGNLTKSIEGPNLVIHQSQECLDIMGEWCQDHHAASGLTEEVLHSTISEREAEKQVMEFVKKNVGTHTPHLAGNSIYTDLIFIKKYMPDLASLFSHVLVDVSSVKALCIRWYPRDQKKAPTKENKHRALDDIRESIAELKYYKDNVFKSRTKK